MAEPLRVVHYVNQFFGGIGGEEQATAPPQIRTGAVGPGRLLQSASGGALQVVATVICGDNYMADQREAALAAVIDLVRSQAPAALIAGPAFTSGRYGEACSAVCMAAAAQLGIPVLTGLSPQSPAAEMYRRSVPIVRTGDSAVDMKNSLPLMGKILQRLAGGDALTETEQAAMFLRGRKRNHLAPKSAAERAIEMVLAKHRGEPYGSELPLVVHAALPPAPAVKGIPHVALVTDGGLILKGNPEKMTSGRSERWCRIDASQWEALSSDLVDVNHFGYDTRIVAAEPNRLVPLDTVRRMAAAGTLTLHPYIYATAGAVTAVTSAERLGREIAQELIDAGVQAVILTST